jgi:serine/threonine protein kinase
VTRDFYARQEKEEPALKSADGPLKYCPQCQAEFPLEQELSFCPRDRSLLVHKRPGLEGSILDGRFQILRRLGAGGYGEVYLAEQTGLKKSVAVKVLRGTIGQDLEKIKRFRQEAQALAKLNHENVCAVHDFGVSEDGRPFLVMDYLPGSSLAELLKLQALEPRNAARICFQLACALESAHTLGIVHRDIKPANVLVNFDSSGQPCSKLLDFGLARIAGQAEKADLTRTGETLGTPAYMSPEQCQAQSLDGRSDIYSLGCLFYECLTGHRCVQSDNPFECMHWHMEKDLPALSASSAGSEQLDPILKKMTARDIAKRYQSASELKADLERFLSGEVKKQPRLRSTAMLIIIALLLVTICWLLLPKAPVVTTYCPPPYYKEQVPTRGRKDAVPEFHNTATAEEQFARFPFLKELRYYAPWSNYGPLRPFQGFQPVKIVECSVCGPVKGVRQTEHPPARNPVLNKPVACGCQESVFAPSLNAFYTSDATDIYEVPAGQKVDEVRGLFFNKCKLSVYYFHGLTYDSKRNRLIAAGSTQDHIWCLMAYDLKEKKWQLLSNGDREQERGGWWNIETLYYSAADDKYYALVGVRNSPEAVLEINPEGTFSRVFYLKYSCLEHNLRPHLFKDGDRIAVCSNDPQQTTGVISVFDINSGDLLMKLGANWETGRLTAWQE